MQKAEHKQNYLRNFSLATALSSIAHLSALIVIAYAAKQAVDVVIPKQVSVKIVEEVKNPEPVKAIEAPKPVAKAPKKIAQTKQHKIRPKPNKISPPAPAKTPVVPPVQGIPPSEVANNNGPGLAVPVGNTLMDTDKGERKKAEDIKALPGEENGTQPQMIKSSIEDPGYSDEALDRGIEGTFTVVVYVDEEGQVAKAELKQKVGFGMDERLINAAKKVRFLPGKDPMGREIGQWTEIKFRLQIP